MDDETRKDVRLTAIAVVELAMRQIADPDQAQARLEEMESILSEVDAGDVALHLAAVLIGVAETCRLPLASLIEEMRKGIVEG